MTEEPGALRRRSVHSALWVAADKWVNRLASLVVFAIIGRLLGASEIGLAALAATVVSLFQVFADQGFSSALVQRKDMRPEHADSAFWLSLTAAAFLGAGVSLTAGPLAEVLRTPELAPVMRVLSLGLVLGALSSVPAALLERDFGFKQLTQRRVIANLSGGVVGVVAAILGAGVWAVVAQSLTSALIGTLILWAVMPWRPRLQVRWQAVRDLRSVGMGVVGIQLFAYLNSQADKFVIGAFLSPSALGYYYIGMRIIGILSDIQTAVIQSISLTALSKLQDDLPRFRRAFTKLAGTSAVIGAFTYAWFAAMAPLLIPLVFGDQWGPSVLIAQILCLLGAINSVIVFDRSALIAVGRPRLALAVTATQSLVGVAAVLIAAPLGIVAVATAVTIRQYLVWPLRLRALRTAIGLPVWGYLRQWLMPIVAGALLFVLLHAGVRLMPDDLPVVAQLGVVTLAGVGGLAIYLGAGVLLFPGTLAEFRSLPLRRRVSGGRHA